jgi:Domain of unknown function (DUF4184)
MPLAIFSHQGLVLPLKMRSPEKFDGTALCVGAATADIFVFMKYIVGHDGWQYFMHSIGGMLVGIPIAIALTMLMSRYIMPWLSDVTTKSGALGKLGVYFGLDEWHLLKKKQFTLKWLGIALVSVIIGYASHLFMDLLGHYVNTIYLPWGEVLDLPPWFSQTIGVSSIHNSDVIWLTETVVFGILSLCFLRIIKRDGLLRKWYGEKVPPMPGNVFSDEIVPEYINEPPFEASETYFNGNMAISKKPPHIWVKASPKNMALTLLILFGGIFIIELIIQFYVPGFREADPAWKRIFSISHITGILAVMIVLYDERYVRAFYIVFIPFLFLMTYVLIFVAPAEYSTEYIISAFLSHLWHYIASIYIIVKKKWTDWQYLLFAGIIYFLYFPFLWYLFPDFRMIFVYGLTETLIFLVLSTFIITTLTFIVQKIRYKPAKNNSKCPFCGYLVKEEDAKCSYCGRDLPTE